MTHSPYNPLAQALNDRLEGACPPVHAMLSELGKRLYFPKGILTQSAEAKQKGTRFNATSRRPHSPRPSALGRPRYVSVSC